jgi:hypothetical protein
MQILFLLVNFMPSGVRITNPKTLALQVNLTLI